MRKKNYVKSVKANTDLAKNPVWHKDSSKVCHFHFLIYLRGTGAFLIFAYHFI